ncbi:MAG: type III PLP-dependent enzyme [Rhodobacteraceae bacterium]|nr:type III PLP-dependent enzyme [Paracoccaceae bacterium]
MQTNPVIWPSPQSHLTRMRPDKPILYFSPAELHVTAHRFITGFDGLVTYAVKANDRAEVLANLVAAGVTTFDVASPAEMQAVRAVCPTAALHYNNPVRSPDEVAEAVRFGVTSASVDCPDELEKLGLLPAGTEIAVRFKLAVPGAAYDFGSKFGATPDQAVTLLKEVAARGFAPSLCFHPGTQCDDPNAWIRYIAAASQIALQADVRLKRLNVGGGFASHRAEYAPDLDAIFDAIHAACAAHFPQDAPQLICEPGRAMVAEAFTLATRVKALRAEGSVLYLNDGIYGGLAEVKDIGLSPRVRVLSSTGELRTGVTKPRIIFGPTCDSLDRLPDGLALPADMQPQDYVLFDGMGAYSIALSSRFNGYGVQDVVLVSALTGHPGSQG